MFHNTTTHSAIHAFKDQLYEVGDRIGQMVFLDLPKITLVETDQLSETERGTGGFGSTNNK